ncbi:MAG: lytic transglycosylase domain-containing protein [Gemmatimonadetes bacterium]|nr:lytic transglycosylase domain-containing protein [Gemmatimonadota bacterium]
MQTLLPKIDTGRRPHRRRTAGVLAIGFLALAASSPAAPDESGLAEAQGAEADIEMTAIERRLDRLDVGLDRMKVAYEQEVRPIEDLLRYYSTDDTLVRRVAVALVRESEAVQVDPRLLTSVLLVENPWLDPTAESSVGAIGLMQVMPFHAGGWGCIGSDLTDLDVNICHGAKVFENALRLAEGNLDRALLRYNGCVRGTTTPDCHLYPSKVYAAAGKAIVRGWQGAFTS